MKTVDLEGIKIGANEILCSSFRGFRKKIIVKSNCDCKFNNVTVKNLRVQEKCTVSSLLMPLFSVFFEKVGKISHQRYLRDFLFSLTLLVRIH